VPTATAGPDPVAMFAPAIGPDKGQTRCQATPCLWDRHWSIGSATEEQSRWSVPDPGPHLPEVGARPGERRRIRSRRVWLLAPR
jgi:hypothetical protein